MPSACSVGLACVDFVNEVESYPEEDSLARATSQTVRRGGNASNTACVLSVLGIETAWGGSVGEGPMAELVLSELKSFGVRRHTVTTDGAESLECAERVPGAAQPTAHIVSSKSTGTRTVVLHNVLPDLGEEDMARFDLEGLEWLHLEVRPNAVALDVLAKRARATSDNIGISVELEKVTPYQ